MENLTSKISELYTSLISKSQEVDANEKRLNEFNDKLLAQEQHIKDTQKDLDARQKFISNGEDLIRDIRYNEDNLARIRKEVDALSIAKLALEKDKLDFMKYKNDQEAAIEEAKEFIKQKNADYLENKKKLDEDRAKMKISIINEIANQK